MALAYEESVPVGYRSAFIERVKQISNRLQIDPNWLMIVMRFETANTFRPDVTNRNSGAVGLIQFTEPIAAKLGTSLIGLKLMTALDQLFYVEKYLSQYTGKMTDIYNTYLAVFAPSYIGRPDAQKVYAAPTTAYVYNKPLDTNNDGVITVGEIKAVIKRYIPAGFENVDTLESQAKPYLLPVGVAAAVLLFFSVSNKR